MLPTSRTNRGRKGGKKKVSGKNETDSATKMTTGPKIIRYTEDGFAVTTLYLRNLPMITRNQLSAYFSKFGVIQNVRIHKNPTHSYGFVTFQQAESAAKALKFKFHSIDGRTVQVTVADSWHQQQPLAHLQRSTDGQSSTEEELPIECTNITGTYLLDLNDDCLYEILSLKTINVIDLCSLAETSVKLKTIATRVFIAKHKILNFNSTIGKRSIHDIRRLLINFGCFINELSIGPSMEFREISTRIMDLIIRYCGKRLESLNLIDFEISEYLTAKLQPLFNKLKRLFIKDGAINGPGKNLFANCASMVELKVLDLINCTDDDSLIYENTFPKLERFSCKETDDLEDVQQLRSFIMRHKSLKTFSVNAFSFDCSSLFQVIADNLKHLDELQIKGSKSYESSEHYAEAMTSLLSLDQLKKVKLNCDGQNITKFMNGLHSLKSLEFLELWHVGDCNFLPTMSKIKTLKVLRLMNCAKLTNLDDLGQLDQLTELAIRRPHKTGPFNIINLIKRLINLKTLHLEMDIFNMDKTTYLKMVDIVRNRPIKQSLEITSISNEYIADIQQDGDNSQFIKFHQFFKSYLSSSDSDYDLDDDDDDDVSWDFDQFENPFDDDFYLNGYYGGFSGGYYDSDDGDDVFDVFFPF